MMSRVGDIELPVLFLASLLELSSREDHVHPFSFGAEAALTLWEVTTFKVLSEAIEEYSSKDLVGYRQE